MLDLSQAKKRKTFRLPNAAKAFFIGLALLPICYGAFILLEYKAFHNNSVPARAVVVNLEPSRTAVSPQIRDQVAAGDFGANELFFVPGFFYTHENGESYVGGALADASGWNMDIGQEFDIRYHRTKPEIAQPISFMTFWAAPVLFIGGGLVMLVTLLIGFFLSERERSFHRPIDFRRTQRLNLRR